MFLLIVFSLLFVGTFAKPEREHEVYLEILDTAEQIIESMEYAKEHALLPEDLQRNAEEADGYDSDGYLESDIYRALDEEGVSPEYFQTFMLAEMADVLLEAPLKDEEELEPDVGRFLCGKCFKRYKMCKDVCHGLISVSADHTVDFIPCATTCLQRISACCVAKRTLKSSSNKNNEKGSGSEDKTSKGSSSLSTDNQGGILAQIQASLQAAGFGSGTGGRKGEKGTGEKGTGAKGTANFGTTKGSIFGSGINFGQGSLFGANFGQASLTGLKGTTSTTEKPQTFQEKIQALLGGFVGDEDKDKEMTSTTKSTTSASTEEIRTTESVYTSTTEETVEPITTEHMVYTESPTEAVSSTTESSETTSSSTENYAPPVNPYK